MAKIPFTAKRVAGLQCPENKAQAFLWDSVAPGLGLRTTPKGQPGFIFQGQLRGKTVRIAIGSPKVWSIPEAQKQARELQRLIDQGVDPRLHRVEQERENVALALTVAESWHRYVEERTPHWGERTRYDHRRIASAGGERQARGTKNGRTQPGPLFELLKYRLSELTPEIVEAWAKHHGEARPTYGRLAWRYFKVFLGWCEREPDYEGVTDPKVAKSRKARDAFGKPRAKADTLDRNQLKAWFEAVRAIPNPVIGAYLQALLLTGGRANELLRLTWDDIDLQWKRVALRDKVEGDRVIPLTPYLESLLLALPRRNAFVFSSPDSKTGTIWSPNEAHSAAIGKHGIQGLTLHGLRRSFATVTEWMELPVGVVAQIMGHKPSATAEKHYRQRSIDLLRRHHENIEKWILEEADILKRNIAQAAPSNQK